jgi:hypothetical protein
MFYRLYFEISVQTHSCVQRYGDVLGAEIAWCSVADRVDAVLAVSTYCLHGTSNHDILFSYDVCRSLHHIIFCNNNYYIFKLLEARIARSSYWPGCGLDGSGFKPRQMHDIFQFSKATRPAVGPTQPHIHVVPGVSGQGVISITCLNLLSRLRMNGASFLLPPCAFLTRTGTTLIYVSM